MSRFRVPFFALDSAKKGTRKRVLIRVRYEREIERHLNRNEVVYSYDEHDSECASLNRIERDGGRAARCTGVDL